MSTAFAIEFIEELNTQLESDAILTAIDFHADKVQHSGDTIKAFCPIHKDSRFRSLLVDSERNAYRCTIKTCSGYTGGSLVELYALSLKIPLLKAACEIIRRVGIEMEPGWLDQLVDSYLKDASAARDNGDFTTAEKLLQEIIIVGPDLPEPRVMLAAIQVEMGNPQAAAEGYNGLIEQFMATEKMAEADSLTTDALSRFPDNEDLLFTRIKIAEELSDKDLVISRMLDIVQRRENADRHLDNIGILEQLVKIAQDRADFAIKLGDLYEQQRNLRGAAGQYEKAAATLLENNQASEGIELLEKVVQFNSENIKARLKLAHHLAENREIDKARDHTFRSVNQRIDQQEFGLAVETVNDWLKREPQNIDARELLARVFFDQERTKEAADKLAEGAEIAAETGDNKRSADLLLRAKFLLPDDATLRRRLIEQFRVTGESQRAAFEIVDLAEILFASDQAKAARQLLVDGSKDDISLSLKLQMASALANHNAGDLALEQLKSHLESLDQSERTDEIADLHELLSRLEPRESAHHLAHVRALWEISPERGAQAAVESAQTLLTQDLAEKAAEVLELTTGLQEFVPATPRLFDLCEQINRPDLAGTIYTVGIQGLADSDPESALKTARRMYSIDPAHPSAASDIAYLLAALDRPNEAAEQYGTVAATLLKAGDYETGLQYAREGVALDPGSISSLSAQALLAREILSSEESEPLNKQLLDAARATSNPNDAATAFLAYIELFPEDVALLDEAASVLKNLDVAEALAQVQSRQAGFLSAAGDWEGAQKKLKAAVEAAPRNPQISEQYGETCRVSGAGDTAAKAFANAANSYAKSNDLDNAHRCIGSAQVAGPESMESWEALFTASESAKMPEIAATAVEQLTELAVKGCQAPGAARWAREWVRIAPESPSARETLGNALIAVDQPESAAQSLSLAAAGYLKNGQTKFSIRALRFSADKGLSGPRDREILAAIADDKKLDSEVRTQANALLGAIMVMTNELDAGRKIAESLDDDDARANLWTSIGNVEIHENRATSDFIKAAHAWQSAGKSEKAVEVLRAAAEQAVTNYAVHSLLAELLTNEKKFDEALLHQLHVLRDAADKNSKQLKPLLKHLREHHGENVEDLTNIARTLLAGGHPDLALPDLEAAAQIASASNDASALVTICGLDENLTRSSGILTRARADSLMGMENEQQALEWIVTSGRDRLAANNATEALEMAQRWISLAPDDPDSHRLYADSCDALKRAEDAAEARVQIARILIKRGDRNEALSTLNRVLDKNSEVESALRLKIDMLKSAESTEEASATCVLLGDLLLETKNYASALGAYRDAAQINPRNAISLRKQADLVHSTESLSAALPIYRRWATLQRELIDNDQWLGEMKLLVEMAPESSQLRRDLSEGLIQAGHSADAAVHLEKLSELLNDEGDFQRAAEALETMISHVASTEPEQYLKVASLYEKGKSLPQAEGHLRRAAVALEGAGRATEAAIVFDDLLKLAGESALPEDLRLAAAAHAGAGNRDYAIELINRGLTELSKHSESQQRRESMLAKALEISSLNPDYVLQYMDLLPVSRAMMQGLKTAREISAAGQPEDAVRVLTQVISLAPHDMSLRQEILEPLRKSGNSVRLRQEIMAMASDAMAAGDTDVAFEALDEASAMELTASQRRALAELNERAQRHDQSAAEFTTSALLYADEGKSEQAVACINRAISAKPSAIPAESLATLVRRLGPDVRDVAREQLRSALTARHQKQSQILALALLEIASPERAVDILKTIYTLGGSTFLVSIARSQVKSLQDDNHFDSALEVATATLDIAPDSPDAWYLAAQVHKSANHSADARRTAMEAARLYSTAGAVSEEEICYMEAAAAEPENLSVKATLAEYFVREKRNDEAVALLQEIISIAELNNNTDILLESLNRAVQVAPANPDLREKLAIILEGIAPDSAIENWLQTAALYHETEQLNKARRVYENVLKLNPTNETALQGLLSEALETGSLKNAEKLSKTLADVKASRKNIGEACRILQSYLELDPDNLPMLERLSALSGKSNDLDVFTATTRALAKKSQKSGDNDGALRHYERLLERSPRDVSLLTNLLDCSAAAGRSDKGLVFARQLLAVARETEDPERIRLAAATILNYDNEDADAHKDLAESLLSLNRISEAVTECMRAAELYEGAGINSSAFACYKRVTDISPSTVQAWRRAGDIAISMGNMDTARMALLHVLDKTSTTDSKRATPLLKRLLETLPDDEGIHQTALDFYKNIDDNERGTEEIIWLAGHADNSGNPERAESLLLDGLKWAPENQSIKMAHYELIKKMGRMEELHLTLRHEADDHEKQGRTEDAISVLRQLSTLSPGQISIHKEIARLLNDAGQTDEAIGQHLEIIRILLERSELEEARDSAEALVEKYPDSPQCREMIADLLVKTNYPDLAARYYRSAADEIRQTDKRIALLRQAVDARPSWIDARKSLADACENDGKLDEAFQARLELIPILLDDNEFSEATATLDQLSKMRPESPEVREQLAELYEKTGNHDKQAAVLKELVQIYETEEREREALEAYRKLAAALPDDPNVLTRYVELLSQLGPTREDLPTEYARLADVLAQRGDFEGAFQTYEQIIGLAPDNTSARSKYAAFLLGRGSRNRALTEMRRLSEIYTEREEPAAAVEVLNAAMTISPRDADLCLALAKAQGAAGLHEDAKVSYARASAILASTAAVKGIDTYRRILTQDPDNTAVRLRLVELLFNSGDKMEAAREARTLAEIHINRGEVVAAENAYRIVDDCEPESVEDIQDSIRRDSYDPSLQYVHYVRLGNRMFEAGDIDNALDAYRTARSLHDDQPELIQKCIDCVSLIAPEAEAIPDYLVMAEKLMVSGDSAHAKQAYEKVRLIDPFNNDAKCGLESLNAAERKTQSTEDLPEDEMVLKAGRGVTKRVALMDLLVACREAASDHKDLKSLT